MSDPTALPPSLDHVAAARWPLRAAAHVLGLGLVLAVVAALPASPSDLDRHQLPKETAVHVATWLAVVLARPFPPAGLRRASLWSCILLLLLSLASAVGATNLWVAARALSLTITGVAAFITARHLAASGRTGTLLGWVAAAGAIGTATGLAQAYGLSSPFFAATRAPGGTFGNRNFMAHFAALVLPIAALATLCGRRWRAFGGWLLTAALVAAIVLSRSRAAWLGAVAMTGVLSLALMHARRRATLTISQSRPLWLFAAAATGIIAAVTLPNALEWRAASPYAETLVDIANHREGSGRGRMVQYRNTLRLASQHPLLGVGPGNWPIRYADAAPNSDPSWAFGDPVPLNPWPSSDWMALLSERGALAVLAVLLLGLSVAWRGWRALATGGDRAVAGATVLALLVTAAVEGVFDAVMLLPVPTLLMALALGGLLQLADGEATLDETVPPPRQLAGVAVTLLLALIAFRSATQTAAYLVAGNGRDIGRLTWAARIDPGSYPIRIGLAERGSCYRVRDDVLAAWRLAPSWPAPRAAARRCGVPLR
ncbi:MAG: O-antigen ligase family protein [Gemmatimonadota bacterium]